MEQHTPQSPMKHEFELYSWFLTSGRDNLVPIEGFFNRVGWQFEQRVLESVNKKLFTMPDNIFEGLPTDELTEEEKKKAVCLIAKLKKESQVQKVELLVENPFSTEPTFFRHGFLADRYSDSLSWVMDTVDDETRQLRLVATKDITALLPAIVPPPPTKSTAYRLFEIEQEYARLKARFRQVSADLSLGPAGMEYYCNANLQVLKSLARQLQEYEQVWQGKEWNERVASERSYLVAVLRQYLKQCMLDIQELFEVYLKLPPLSSREIDQKFFGGQPAPTQTAPAPQPQRVINWHSLFKDSEAANAILSLLREEEIVAADSRWLAHPPLLTMIALYNVLKKRGYLVTTPVSAKELATIFNQQFHTAFSDKKWQPAGRESAEFYEDRFNLIRVYTA